MYVFKPIGPGVVRGDKMTSSDSISSSPTLTPSLTQSFLCACASLWLVSGERREKDEKNQTSVSSASLHTKKGQTLRTRPTSGSHDSRARWPGTGPSQTSECLHRKQRKQGETANQVKTEVEGKWDVRHFSSSTFGTNSQYIIKWKRRNWTKGLWSLITGQTFVSKNIKGSKSKEMRQMGGKEVRYGKRMQEMKG